jgi:hypothetical protein
MVLSDKLLAQNPVDENFGVTYFLACSANQSFASSNWIHTAPW